MEPVAVIGLITAALPFITAAAKKILHTEKWPDRSRKGIHALIPIVLGIFSSGLYEYSRGSDWVTALAVGLGSGGAASSARDIEKHLINLVGSIQTLINRKPQDQK